MAEDAGTQGKRREEGGRSPGQPSRVDGLSRWQIPRVTDLVPTPLVGEPTDCESLTCGGGPRPEGTRGAGQWEWQALA